MTLHELGIADLDCGFDPDGLLDGPPADGSDGNLDMEATDADALPGIDDDQR